MSFNPNAKDTGFARELIPSGPHAARCARVIEIGKQWSDKFQSESNKVVIVLALPNVLVDINGEKKQAFVSNRYGVTVSAMSKNLKQYTQALDPNEEVTDFGGFLNRTCAVFMKHKERDGKVYSNLDSVSPLLPGTPVPELDVTPIWFQWDRPDPAVYKQLPEFQRTIIKSATNFKGSLVEEMVNELEGSSDLPM